MYLVPTKISDGEQGVTKPLWGWCHWCDDGDVIVVIVDMVMSLLQIKRSQIRKGMVMVDPVLNPMACWEFDGDILVLHHPTTISTKYQAMGKQAL